MQCLKPWQRCCKTKTPGRLGISKTEIVQNQDPVQAIAFKPQKEAIELNSLLPEFYIAVASDEMRPKVVLFSYSIISIVLSKQ